MTKLLVTLLISCGLDPKVLPLSLQIQGILGNNIIKSRNQFFVSVGGVNLNNLKNKPAEMTLEIELNCA